MSQYSFSQIMKLKIVSSCHEEVIKLQSGLKHVLFSQDQGNCRYHVLMATLHQVKYILARSRNKSFGGGTLNEAMTYGEYDEVLKDYIMKVSQRYEVSKNDHIMRVSRC